MTLSPGDIFQAGHRLLGDGLALPDGHRYVRVVLLLRLPECDPRLELRLGHVELLEPGRVDGLCVARFDAARGGRL